AAGDVHHVDDDRARLGLVARREVAVALVLLHRHDHRIARAVGARRDLPLQRLLEGALEVAQALRSAAADPRETAGLRPHGLLAARLDVRQLELLTEDLGEFLEADVDLEDVLARVLTRLSGARL